MNTKFRVDKYEIEWDGLAWCLSKVWLAGERKAACKPVKPENVGKERYKVVGWYSTLDRALARLLDEKLGESGAKSAQELLEIVALAENHICVAAREVPKQIAGYPGASENAA